MQKGSTLSLTIMVIFLALLGLFVGYLLGNWIIQLLTGGIPVSEQISENKVIEEELVVEDESAEQSAKTYVLTEDEVYQESDDLVENQLRGEVYVVQVGAFQHRNNALTLKNELSKKGFQAVITEGIPYKVQLVATGKAAAEKMEQEIETYGYDAFITH